MSRPELISDYPHSELNLGVERRRTVLPPGVGKEIARRPIMTTTAVVLLAAAAAGVAAGVFLNLRASRPKTNGSGKPRRTLADLIG